MTITQISTSKSDDYGVEIFGLGEDNKIYYWNSVKTEWILEKYEKANNQSA